MHHLSRDDLELVGQAVDSAGRRGHSFLSTHLGFHGLDDPGCVWQTNGASVGITITAKCLACRADLVIQTGNWPTILGVSVCSGSSCQECRESDVMKAIIRGSLVIFSPLETSEAA